MSRSHNPKSSSFKSCSPSYDLPEGYRVANIKYPSGTCYLAIHHGDVLLCSMVRTVPDGFVEHGRRRPCKTLAELVQQRLKAVRKAAEKDVAHCKNLEAELREWVQKRNHK